MLIKGAKVYTGTNNIPKVLDVLVENGRIKKVAPNIRHTGGEVFDASAYSLMPGIIDTSSRLGLITSGIRWEGNDSSENSENNLSRFSAKDSYNAFDESIKEASKSGITTAVVTSGENSVIGAKSCAIKTTGGAFAPSVVSDFCDLPVTFGNHPKRLNDKAEFPRSRMGIVSILRSALIEASLYGESKLKNGTSLSSYNESHEAMLKVIKGEVPLKVLAYKHQDILTAIRIQKEFGIKMILNQCVEAYSAIGEIAASGLPVVVGNYLVPIGDYEELGRKMDMPAALEEHGVKFSFSTHTQEIGYSFMAINAGLMVNYGLSEETALKALTIDAAKIFGLEQRIGSIEEGKDADLLILDGKPLYSNTKVIKTMINGQWID